MKVYIDLLYPYLVPVIIIGVSVVMGIIFEKVIMVRLKRFADRTVWKGDDIIVESFKGNGKILILIAGLYTAVLNAPLKESVINGISKSVIVVFIFLITIISARIATGFVKIYSKSENTIFPVTSIFSNLTKMTILLIGTLLVLQFLGISITPILTALGVGGLAVALALQDTLSNLFAGIQVIITGQINIGDYIMIQQDIDGHVMDISWRYTTVKTLTNNMIVIPNSKIASSLLSNYSLPEREMNIKIPVGVAYASNLEEVETVTLEVAEEIINETPGAVKDFEPYLRFTEFGESSINFNVFLKISDFTKKYVIRHEFIKRLHRRYNEKGIEIPFPMRTVHLKNAADK